MKKFIVLFFLMMSLFSFAQEKYPVYCDICVYENHEGFSKYSKVNFDFGGRRNVDLLDESGNAKQFVSYIEAMDYLSKLGWKLKDTYVLKTFVPGVIEPRFQYIHVLHCLMEKMVYSDEEIKKGLTFSTIERKNEKKENIVKDGKRKILLSKRQKHENIDDDE